MSKDPNQLVDLVSLRTEMQAAIVAGRLREHGIEVFVFATAGSMMQWELPTFAPARVQVRRDQFEDAQRLLASWSDRGDGTGGSHDQVDADQSRSGEVPGTNAPHDSVIATGAGVALGKLIDVDREGHLRAAYRCGRCDYNLRGLKPPYQCPECGAIDPELDPTCRCAVCGTDLSDATDQTECPTCAAAVRGVGVGRVIDPTVSRIRIAAFDTAEAAHEVRRFLHRASIEAEVVSAVDHSPTSSGGFAVEIAPTDRPLAHSALLFARKSGFPIPASAVQPSATDSPLSPSDWFTQCGRCGHKQQPGHRSTQCQRCGSDRVSYVHSFHETERRQIRKLKLWVLLVLAALTIGVQVAWWLTVK